jgi:thiamine biosynthesis lipoprotein
LLPLVGWHKVQWQDRRIRLPEAGMELDFGGFGKEYAADRAASVLFQHGIRHALVNLGGDVQVLGPRGLPESQGQPWQVGVQHPRPTPSHDLVASLPLGRGALATSGDYERFFEVEGRRYCHILDPRSGWPVFHWQSVTVLAPNASTAGALSTIAMLMGEGALEWLNGQDSAYLAVRHDDEIFRRGTA